MKELNHILFVSQQIYPFLDQETPIRVLNRKLPEWFQSSGYETRTFMPKFGDINERRNQLHEVIRLSGMNIIISEVDHPLLIKVASIQSARIQIYFIDNDDYFYRRKGLCDTNGEEWKDNDERSIFFARGVLETVKKLRWTPTIVHCSGWMSALTPLFLKKLYADTPFFEKSKVIVSLDDEEYTTPFNSKFANKIVGGGILNSDVRGIAGLPVGYEDLMRLAIDYADAIVLSSENVNQRLLNYAQNSGKPIMPYVGENKEAYLNFYNSLLDNKDEDEDLYDCRCIILMD
jgi:starch synthase